MWIPKNKKTGIKYPPVTDKEREEMQLDPAYRGKYVFIHTPDNAKSPNQAQSIAAKVSQSVVSENSKAKNMTPPEPIESKRVETTTAENAAKQ